MARLLLSLLTATVLVGTARAGLEEGLVAYGREEYAVAFDEFRTAAKRGVTEAQYMLGVMYASGQSVPANDGDALRWFTLAAEGGHADAQFRVASMRESNPMVAYKWYKAAAAQGHVEAQFAIGNLYADGVQVPQNYEKAFEWYKLAAEQGYVLAQYELGRYYEVGLESVLCTRSPSPAKCRERTRTAHQQTVKQDDEIAFEWFLKAAQAGHAAAQLQVGRMYEDGRGTGRDYGSALKWYKKAAEQGLVEAQYKVMEHEQSPAPAGALKVPDIATRAADMRRAEEGSVEAQLKVARMFGRGIGVPKDYVQAYLWYNLAAAQGDAAARSERDELEQLMTARQIADSQRLSREMLQRIQATAGQ